MAIGMYILNGHTLTQGLNAITARDSDMDRVFKEAGTPPLRRREPRIPDTRSYHS